MKDGFAIFCYKLALAIECFLDKIFTALEKLMKLRRV